MESFDPSRPLFEVEEPETNPVVALPGEPADPLSSFDLVSPTDRARQPDSSPAVELGATPTARPPEPGRAPSPREIMLGSPLRPRPSRSYRITAGAIGLTWGIAGIAYLSGGPLQLPEVPARAGTPQPDPLAPPAASSPTTPAQAPRDAAPDAAVPEPAPAPDGWTVTAAHPPLSIVAIGGAVAATFIDHIGGFSDGVEVWRKEGAYDAVVPASGTIFAALEGTLYGWAADTGETSLELELPRARRSKKTPQVAAAHVAGDQLLLALQDARFLAGSISTCLNPTDPSAATEGTDDEAGAKASCLRQVGSLRGEYIEPTAMAVLGEEGMRYLSEDDSVRAFDLGFARVFSVVTPTPVQSMVAVPGNRLALQFGREVALLDSARCRSRGTIELGSDTDGYGPPGCVLWRYGTTVQPSALAVVDTASLAVNEGGTLSVVTEGDDAWKLPVGAVGPVVAGNDETTYAVVVHPGTKVLELAAFDARTGQRDWSRPIPGTVDAEGPLPRVRLAWSEGQLAYAVGPNIGVANLSVAKPQ